MCESGLSLGLRLSMPLLATKNSCRRGRRLKDWSRRIQQGHGFRDGGFQPPVEWRVLNCSAQASEVDIVIDRKSRLQKGVDLVINGSKFSVKLLYFRQTTGHVSIKSLFFQPLAICLGRALEGNLSSLLGFPCLFSTPHCRGLLSRCSTLTLFGQPRLMLHFCQESPPTCQGQNPQENVQLKLVSKRNLKGS